MLNIIAIGSTVTLDMQTRMLIRRSDEQSVTLPTSACLCLRALVQARGEVLSQEQLMDIGWRSEGVEVTENSVRVMINKVRRALMTLEQQDVITLIAVTRSGYRLIVREGNVAQPPAVFAETEDSPPVKHSPETAAQPAASPARRKWRKPTMALLGGLVAGLALGGILYNLYAITPEKVDFVPWQGAGIPANSEVRVQKDKQDRRDLIEATLNIYSRYVLDKRPGEKPGKVLYITLGSGHVYHHLGLIACQQPFQDKKNDCESFYFRVY